MASPLIALLALSVNVLDCGGKTVPVDSVISLNLSEIQNCRFEISEGGGIGFEGVRNVTVRNSSFISVGSNWGLAFNDSNHITVRNCYFEGFRSNALVFTGGSNITILDSIFDAPEDSTGETLVISPGHDYQIRRVWSERGSPWRFDPASRFKRGTGLGGALLPLKSQPRAWSDGGRIAAVPVVPWRRGLPVDAIYWDDERIPDSELSNLRVRCFWPGMTGLERFRISGRDEYGLLIEVFFGKFPSGDFAVYVDNPARYIENVTIKRNTFRGGGLSGFSGYFVRNVEIRDNVAWGAKDYGLGVEFAENVSFIGNRVFESQGNYNAYEVVGWADGVRFRQNIGTAAMVPWGKPQRAVEGAVFRGPAQEAAVEKGFPAANPSRV